MGGQQSAAKAAPGDGQGDASSSSFGKGRPANNQVQLAVSVLGGVPGATAYHSSVIVNGHEFFFSDGGIASSGNLMSHKNPQMPDSKPEVIDMGMSPYTGSQMQAALERYFISGTYDLLRKNCNSFSDCALFYLLHKRIDKKYRQMEKLGASLHDSPFFFGSSPAMDGYSTKKRSEDGICRLSLDAPNRVQQRSISASRLEGMKQEAKMAREWGKKVKDDLHFQQGNVKALAKDTLASKTWGGPNYRHVAPNQAQSHEYQRSMQAMTAIAIDISTKQDAVEKAMREDYRSVHNTRADTSVSSLSAWLEKYGRPVRQAEPQERYRTTPCKQRRT
eukprot:symbB.v1.2.036942.t2/scaffold5335.1/size28330/5